MFNRNTPTFKLACWLLAVNFLISSAWPATLIAAPSGPSQPEVQSFSPAGNTEMVNLFTGDFTYNIPLFELPGPNGGYPFNLSYSSGITMHQEASWVGLGWNLFPGAITRNKRGLPDEFKGDVMTIDQDIKEMHTYGMNAGGGIEIFGGTSQLGLDLSFYYNNYRGFGYGFGTNIGLSPDASDGSAPSVGFNFDSQNGPASKLSVGSGLATFGVAFNAESGPRLNLLAQTMPASVYSYTPKVSMEYRTTPLYLNVKIGALPGIYTNAFVGGFYNTQKLKKTHYTRGAFGYYNLEDPARGKTSLLDFNREKEGVINEKTPNLPVPVLTADHYSISGQGISGSFRAWRNDYGSVYDSYAESTTNGGSLAFDVPADLSHFGLAGNFIHGRSTSGPWEEDNGFKNNLDFITQRENYYEPAYFKIQGEHTFVDATNERYIGGKEAVKSVLSGFSASNNYINSFDKTISGGVLNKSVKIEKRELRGKNIQPITNSLLLNGTTEMLPEYKVSYYTAADDTYLGDVQKLTRSGSNYPAHHFAGMTVVKEDGTRYVYGLPAINTKEVQATFSVDQSATDYRPYTNVAGSGSSVTYKHNGTDEFLSRTETPPYAHSYLLTSVLGHDYVDVNDNGPDEDDYGYWVKFTYRKADSDYKWRSPYRQASYDMGVRSKFSDNRGSYQYGEKELWYVATAETRTHVAVFEISSRSDSREAKEEVTNDKNLVGASMKQLDKIVLYTRAEYDKAVTNGNFNNSIPLKTIEFGYDNSLCNGIDNSSSGGKLTLKTLKIHYQNNERGKLTPYTFTYTNNVGYSNTGYDRWGNYHPGIDNFTNKNLPYVPQFNLAQDQSLANKNTYQGSMDSHASAWHLSGITTPTGSQIDITYEADDYAYVQHRQATQMFYLDKLAFSSSDSMVYDNGFTNGESKIYFKLEDPIPASLGGETARQMVYDQYLKGLQRSVGNNDYIQIYYKVYANIKNNIWEYVTGYSNFKSGGYDIDQSRTTSIDIDGSGAQTCYTHAYVELEPYTDPKTSEKYHPFANAVWQAMVSDYPELLVTGNVTSASPGSSDFDKAVKVKSLVGFIPQIKKMFKGYREHAFDEGWGKYIDLSKSVVKLCTPDGKKYGGGQRVKSIVQSDNFSVDGSADVYGKVYDYTTTNENGTVISAGVAAYEPALGNEENALRYARVFNEKNTYRSPKQASFEYPINENYYPAPTVGYSKVTVRSLATDSILSSTYSNQLSATGEEVHEFYTARDFPTRTDETFISKKTEHINFIIPLIGSVSHNKLSATQGYAVETNDMHGKPRKVAYYGISKGQLMKQAPVSEVEYQYQSEPLEYEGVQVNRLTSDIDALYEGDDLSTAEFTGLEMGTHYEFFADHNESHSYQRTGGGSANVENFLLIPLPNFWPSYVESSSRLRTAVLNKAVHRSGILSKTMATDGLATTETENITYHPYDGSTVLSRTQNSFENDVYNYTVFLHPSFMNLHFANDRLHTVFNDSLKMYSNPYFAAMPSYQTYSAVFKNRSVTNYDSTSYYYSGAGGVLKYVKNNYNKYYEADIPHLYPGNKLLLIGENGAKHIAVVSPTVYSLLSGLYTPFNTPRMVHPPNCVLCSSYSGKTLYCDDNINTGQNYDIYVIEPGNKNVLNAVAESITVLDTFNVLDTISAQYNLKLNTNDTIFADALENAVAANAKAYQEIWADMFTDENPYLTGKTGILKLKQNFTYQSDRRSDGNMAGDGVYLDNEGANKYIVYNSAIDYNLNQRNENPYWVADQTITRYNNNSHPVESKNAIGVFSSSHYGYYESLMRWEASNARYHQVYFNGLEDHTTPLKLKVGTDVNPYTTKKGHTGSGSLEVTAVTEYQLPVKPVKDRTYYFSCWMRADETTYDYNVKTGMDANSRGVVIKYYNNDHSTLLGNTGLIKPLGRVIEGWQKIEGTFTMDSANVEKLVLEAKPGTAGGSPYTIWLDDIRLCPNQANMKTYVYDPATYRLRAILDENNYASLYYYDEEGKLFLTKKETERGIFTIQESRSYK